MTKWKLYWFSGDTEIIEGYYFAEAMMRAGYAFGFLPVGIIKWEVIKKEEIKNDLLSILAGG